jgi:predicted kinase
MIWQIHHTYNWDSLHNEFDWIRDMEAVPQDPIFHAEGNVGIHTRMVLEALDSIKAFSMQDEQERHLLKAAALLHDIKKRSTTREENGRIISPGHARKGAKTTNALLYRMGDVPFDIRRQLVGLVRYYGLPLWVLEKPDPQKAIISASWEVRLDLLSVLAEADVRGRICEDQAEMFEKVAFFRAYAQEQNCLSIVRSFETEAAAFHYFQRGGTYPGYVPFESDGFEVTLLSGLPGSGKDFFIEKKLGKDFPVISLDALRRQYKKAPTDKRATGRIVQEAKEMAKAFLRKRQPFVWNATNITRTMREQLISLFADYGATVRLVYVEVPYTQLLQQNKNRQYPIPETVLESMIDKLELPSPVEAYFLGYQAPSFGRLSIS